MRRLRPPPTQSLFREGPAALRPLVPAPLHHQGLASYSRGPLRVLTHNKLRRKLGAELRGQGQPSPRPLGLLSSFKGSE